MTLAGYLKDRAFSVSIGVVCALAIGGILLVLGDGVEAALLAAALVLLCFALVIFFGYVRQRSFYSELSHLVKELNQIYFASALLEKPDFLEGMLTYEALEAIGKAAADDVSTHRQQAESYRDYIELWIHEIKTPIAAAHLMAASLHGPEASKLKGELDRIESYVEQALYYARSTSLAHDYAIHEIPLAECLRDTCKKQARFMIEQGTTPVIKVDNDVRVFADAKWLSFIVGQVVVNAAKYGAQTVTLSTRAEGQDAAMCTVLEIADNGWGIPAGDVPRVFDRGFTGVNGRAQGSSTGMGLYLVAQMCEKMGLSVGLASEEGVGTRVMISFPHDRRRLDAVR